MDQRFETLQRVESEWPLPSPDANMYYDDFYKRMHRVSVNHICVSCACIDHSPSAGSTCAVDVELLRPLQINSEEVPFPFLCGVEFIHSFIHSFVLITLAFRHCLRRATTYNNCYYFLLFSHSLLPLPACFLSSVLVRFLIL